MNLGELEVLFAMGASEHVLSREPLQGLSWPRSGRVVCSSTTQPAPCRSGFLAFA